MRDHGAEILFVVVTCGESGGLPEVRGDEALASAEFVDAEIRFGGLLCSELSEHVPDAITLIEQAIADWSPELIITHTSHDRHQDHRNVAMASFSAARRWCGKLLCYDSTRGLEGFDPRYFVRIDAYMTDKLKAVAEHESQSHRGYMRDEILMGEAAVWGSRLGTYGLYEAFEVKFWVD